MCRESLVFIPRKNAKSTIAAIVANGLLLLDREPGAQIYSAARNKGQAGIVFDLAKWMLENSDLRSRVRIYKDAIEYPKHDAVYRVLTAGAGGKHGFNAHGVVLDELHEQEDREMLDVLRTSMGARRQPLLFMMTTAGIGKNTICWEKYEYAKRVHAGVIEDPEFHGVIYEVDEKLDWTDPATWAAANPLLGDGVSIEYLARECRLAQATPGYENTFRRLHLNQWTEQATRWLAVERWDACRAADSEIRLDDYRDRPCWLALDLSATQDLTSLGMCFHGPASEDEEGIEHSAYDVLNDFWMPAERAAEREKQDRVPFLVWAREGHLRLIPGRTIRHEAIRRRIHELAQIMDIQEIAVDPWNAVELSAQLESDGFTVVPMRQGYATMSAPSKLFADLIADRRIRHDGNPVMRWCVQNVAIESDHAANIRPSKELSTDRIDGVPAAIMALARASLQGDEGSVYDDGDILEL